jgi:hypothetical protein
MLNEKHITSELGNFTGQTAHVLIKSVSNSHTNVVNLSIK